MLNTYKNNFYSKVLLPNENGCMLWTASKLPNGYGQFTYRKIQTRSHRFSYILHVGNIPNDMYVCHRCDIPSCVSPDHLFLGTPKDNMVDKIKKGRGRWGNHEKNGMAKLTLEKANYIRKLIKDDFFSITKIADIFGVSDSVIHEIRANKTWRND